MFFAHHKGELMNVLDKARLLQTTMLAGLMLSLSGAAYAQSAPSVDANTIDAEDEDILEIDPGHVHGGRREVLRRGEQSRDAVQGHRAEGAR